MNRLPVRRVGLALLCGAVGFGMNSMPGAAVAPLLLGRAVTLPIAILFGPSLGVLPAARGHVRQFAFHAFVLVATLPLLLLAAVGNQVTAAKQEADGSARLREAVTSLSEHIGDYVGSHTHAVESLAASVGQRKLDSADRQQLLTEYKKVYPGFITLFVADRAGIVHEVFPTRSGSPPVSDREYFIQALRTKAMAVSDVILGRLSHVPIVTIAVPLIDAGGTVTGVAGGSLGPFKVDRFVPGFRTLSGP